MQQAAPPADSVSDMADDSLDSDSFYGDSFYGDNSAVYHSHTMADDHATTAANTLAEQNNPDTVHVEQPFASNVTDNTAKEMQEHANLQAQQQSDEAANHTPAPVTQAKAETQATTKATTESTATPANTENPQVVANPLDLLTCPTVELVGEWTLEKWEYWLRNASLIPAVLNLAHKGVMTGEIGKNAHFQVPKEVEKVAHDEFFQRLKARLQEDWANMQVSYEILDTSTSDQLTNLTTPEQQQIKRKQQAQQAAEEKMHQEPVVKALVTEFNAVVEKIELKTTG